MLTLGLNGKYVLVRRGRRPRSAYSRRMTAESACRRFPELMQDASSQLRLLRFAKQVGLQCTPTTLESELLQALRQEKIHLYRNVQLSTGWVYEEVVPLSTLVTEEAEALSELAEEPWLEVVVEAEDLLRGVVDIAVELPGGGEWSGPLAQGQVAQLDRAQGPREPMLVELTFSGFRSVRPPASS